MVDGFKKSFSRSADQGLRIEAFVPVAWMPGEYRRIMFHANQVTSVLELDEKRSGIILESGVAIPVAIAFDKLKIMIYEPDFKTGNSIDLTLVTGAVVADAVPVKLSTNFNPVSSTDAEAAKGPEKALEIILYARTSRAQDRQYKRYRIQADRISFFEPNSERKGSETYIRIRQSDSSNLDIFAQIPAANFAQQLALAKAERRESIDLCDITAPIAGQNFIMG